MDVSRRRAGVKTGVVAGSVWESRMRSDEVRGGIKVFSGDEKTEKSTDNNNNNNAGDNACRTKRTGSVGGKRKTWKPEGGDGSSLQTSSARGKGELSKNGDEMVKEVSVSADGPMKKSPAVARRGKRDAVASADQAIQRSPVQVRQRSPVQVRRSRSGAVRGSVEKSSVELRKVKSDSAKILNQSRSDGGDGESEENAVRLSTANSGPPGVLDGSCQQQEEDEDEDEDEDEEDEEEAVEKEAIDGSAEGHEDDPDGVSKPDEIRKEVISSNVSQVKPAPKEPPREDDNNGSDTATNDLVEEEEEEEFSEESEKDEGEGELDEDTDTEPENKTLEIKEIVVTEQKASYVVVKEEETKPDQVTENPKPLEIKEIVVTEQKASDVVVEEEETKPNQVTENPKPISPIAKKKPPPPPVVKQTRVHRKIANLTPSKTFTSSSNVHKEPPPVTRRSSLHRNFATKTNSFSDKYQSFPERENKLQSLVDLFMWRDVSKSALIFGLGTFVVISSSYTRDISFSFIAVISYLGLFYLAAIFLYRSIICRGYVDKDGSSCVLGEEEAIWLLKLVLPYLNEFLLKLKALFSGDPGTTMKLAVLLFVLARCGSSITIWKIAKFGFFGVFTVPKVCSSYSSQITAYGKFWIRRFRDAWNSCSHKKAVAAGVFTLVWNLCSVVARIWAVFMLYVAFRYYQQNLVKEDWAEDNECADDKCRGRVGGPNTVESSKGKKAS